MDITYFDKTNSKVDKYIGLDIINPGICGHCKNSGDQVILAACELPSKHSTDPLDDDSSVLVVSSCHYCHLTTEHYYEYEDYDHFVYSYSYPNPIDELNIELSPYIQEKYPEFSKIFHQSKSAEQNDLNHLAGMGYRKSLEFLVTDFLLEFIPEGVKEDWIKSHTTTLSQKISKLKNKRLRDIAKAISFLGNDETHYTRRHPEHDVDSIKRFLKVFLSDIENEINFLEIESFLKKPS